MSRGFDEHMGYYQGCGSKWTHVASCCKAHTPTKDQHYVCPAPKSSNFRFWEDIVAKDYRGKNVGASLKVRTQQLSQYLNTSPQVMTGLHRGRFRIPVKVFPTLLSTRPTAQHWSKMQPKTSLSVAPRLLTPSRFFYTSHFKIFMAHTVQIPLFGNFTKMILVYQKVTFSFLWWITWI